MIIVHIDTPEDVLSAPSNLPDGTVSEPARIFDDSQFSDYDMGILAVILNYGKFKAQQLVDILHHEDCI